MTPRPRQYDCRICNKGTGNSTCFSCVLGLTSKRDSPRYKRLVEKSIIANGTVVTMGQKLVIDN